MDKPTVNTIITEVELLRDGLKQAYTQFATQKDPIGMACMQAHHHSANKLIKSLGGQPVKLTPIDIKKENQPSI